MTTSVSGFRDLGRVDMDSPFAAVCISTRSTTGASTGDIIVIVPTSSVQRFAETIRPKGDEYPEINATFATLQGEPALIVGEFTPAVLSVKPSKLLADQYAAKSQQSQDAKPQSERSVRSRFVR